MGEPLVQFSPLDPGPMSQAGLFDKHAAGSESNVLIGVSRLGLRTALITKLGTDELSRFVLSTLKGEGVDTRWISLTPDRNCGVYVAQRNYPLPGKSDVVYFRSGSAASTLSEEDVPVDVIRSSRVVHISGITPALSESCRKAAIRFAEVAKKHHVTFSFDLNYRRKLWPALEAGRVFADLVGFAEVVFLDRAEASLLLGKDQSSRDPERILEAVAALGPRRVILKLGPSLGLAALDGGMVRRAPSFQVPVVDVIGAGDAVASGFLSGILKGKDVMTSLKWGLVSSALVVMRRGDFENLPTPADLKTFLKAQESDIDLR